MIASHFLGLSLTMSAGSLCRGNKATFILNSSCWDKPTDLLVASSPPVSASKEKIRFTQKRIENLRKLFIAQAQDLRVIIIELVSRVDNLNTLSYLSPEKQKLTALETLKIFVSIADRLGIGEIKSKLEDLKKDLIKINTQRFSGSSVENPGRIKHIKRTIARIKTYVKIKKEEMPKT